MPVSQSFAPSALHRLPILDHLKPELSALRRKDDGTTKPQSPSRLETLLVRVIPPDSKNAAFLVGSASFTRLKMASDTSTGAPTRSQAGRFQTTKAASSAIQASQPGRGTRRIQTPSTQKAKFRPQPDHRPVAPDATICRSPSFGLTGGAVRVRSRTDSCTMASSRRSAS